MKTIVFRWCAVMLLLALCALRAHAATREVTTSTNWSAIGATAADTVIIKNNATVTIDTATAACALLYLGSGDNPNRGTGRILFNAGTQLTVSGTVDLGGLGRNGLIDMTAGGTLSTAQFAYTGGTLTPGAGTIVMTATNTIPNGLATFNNFNVSAGTTSLSAAKTFNGGVTISGTGRLNGGTSLTHNVSGNWTISSSDATPFTYTTGSTINFTTPAVAAATTISSTTATPSFNNLNINNTSGVAVSRSTNVNGTLTIGAGATLTPAADAVINSAASAGTLTGTGTAKVTRTAATADFASQYRFNASTLTNLTVDYAGAAAQTVSALSYGSLTISNTNAAVSAPANFNVSNTMTVASGATFTPAATTVINSAAVAGTLTGAGTIQVTRIAATADLSSQYRFTTRTLTGATVEYAGTAAQTVSGLAYGGLTINNASGVALAGATSVAGTLTLSAGTMTVGANTLTLGGAAIAGTSNNLVTSSASSLAFTGSSTGVFIPASVTSLSNLTINNVNGVSAGNVAVGGVLTLTSGPLMVASSSRVAATASCTAPSVSRGAGFVEGSLQLTYPAGGAACTFAVGNGNSYAPIAVTTTTGGTLTGSTRDAEHPNISTSAIESAQNANRYWSLWASGDTMNAASYSATFTFVAGDTDNGSTPTSFALAKYQAGAWSSPSPVTASATTISASALTGLNSATDFAAGESLFTCVQPSGVPSGVTCVCDNFDRTTVNPSTIFGGDYVLSQSSGTAGWPRIATSRLLQLTNNTTNMATSVTLPGSFPAKKNYISIDFKFYGYNGSGADGIALTLSNAAIVPKAGAYGGSLGYAQKNNANCATPPCNGFAGGWIGVGIDEFGNYSSATEGRSGGPGTRADAIAVRGSGSGLTGYPYLAGTASLTPGVDTPGSATLAPGHSYRVVVDARCYQDNSSTDVACNNASLARKAQVSVYRDTTGAGNFTTANRVLDFDAYTANPAQDDVPDNWKLSFTGSTGAAANIHEIHSMRVCAQTITPPAGYLIQVDNVSPSTCATPGGSPASPIVTVTAVDSNGNLVTDYAKTINLSAKLASGATSAAVWRKVGATANLVGNQYTFTAADNGSAKFYLTNASTQSVYITISENGGTLSSTLAGSVDFTGATFTIASSDTLGDGVVGGRNHLFTVTRTNGCTVNTAYTGSKALDGWYTPVTSDHPTGAKAPSLCAPNASGTCLPATGTCQELSIAEPTVSTTDNKMPTLTFTAGVAKFCLATSDVGKYSLSLRDDSSTSVKGSSGSLTVRPFAIVVSDVKTTSASNPSGSAPASAVFTTAGSSFGATVGGYLWNSSSDANNDGLPDAGVGIKTMIAGGVPASYADTISLTAADTGYFPSSGVRGTVGNGTVAVVGGTGTTSTLNYSEVGAFTLQGAPASASFLNSGVDLSPRVLVYATGSTDPGNTASPAPSGVVGRFKPHYFAISNQSVTDRSERSCSPASSFTYMGEPMRVSFTLTAYNANGERTQNYSTASSYAKLSNTSWTAPAGDGVGLWAAGTGYPAGTGSCGVQFGISAGVNTLYKSCSAGTPVPVSRSRAAGSRVNLYGTPATPAWNAGIANFQADVVIDRPDVNTGENPDGPYNISFGIVPTDTDGVTVTGADLDTDFDGTFDRVRLNATAKDVRFGRLKLSNAHGSERLNLPIDISTEYWKNTANGFITNVNDSCTTLASSNFALMNPVGAINAGNLPTFQTSTVSFAGGIGKLILRPPATTIAGRGGITLCTDLDGSTVSDSSCAATGAVMPWLQGRWGGTSAYSFDPAIRATFGFYRGGPVIYMREMY